MPKATTDANDADEGRSRRFWALVVLAGLALQLILVAAVGGIALSYVTGLGTTLPASPTADFHGDAVDGSYVLTHEGGNTLRAANVVIRRNDEAIGTWAELSLLIDADGEVSPGDRVAVPNATEGDRMAVVWQVEDESATMYSDEVGPLRTPTLQSNATDSPQRSSRTTETPRPAT